MSLRDQSRLDVASLSKRFLSSSSRMVPDIFVNSGYHLKYTCLLADFNFLKDNPKQQVELLSETVAWGVLIAKHNHFVKRGGNVLLLDDTIKWCCVCKTLSCTLWGCFCLSLQTLRVLVLSHDRWCFLRSHCHPKKSLLAFWTARKLVFLSMKLLSKNYRSRQENVV